MRTPVERLVGTVGLFLAREPTTPFDQIGQVSQPKLSTDFSSGRLRCLIQQTWFVGKRDLGFEETQLGVEAKLNVCRNKDAASGGILYGASATTRRSVPVTL